MKQLVRTHGTVSDALGSQTYNHRRPLCRGGNAFSYGFSQHWKTKPSMSVVVHQPMTHRHWEAIQLAGDCKRQWHFSLSEWPEIYSYGCLGTNRQI